MKVIWYGIKYLLSFFFILSLFSSCGTYFKPYYDNAHKQWDTLSLPSAQLVHEILLFGDMGADTSKQKKVAGIADTFLRNLDSNDLILFLGDNIYPAGLPIYPGKERREAETRLLYQLRFAKKSNARAVFVPGNHDWNKWAEGGLARVREQDRFVDNFMGYDAFKPSFGCAGPEVIELSDDYVVITFDFQWWLQDWSDEPDINATCEVKSRIQLLDALANIFSKYDDQQVFLFMHHPIFSNGNHGGRFSMNQHFFPLRDANPYLFIPMPVLGSLVAVYRRLTGHNQDIPHEKYQALREELMRMIEGYDNVITAAGHEHSLQYFQHEDDHHIVSGSSSKSTFARRGLGASMVYAVKGFSRLLTYDDGQVWVEFYALVQSDNSKGELIFRKRLVQPREDLEMKVKKEEYPELADSVVITPSDKYSATNFKKFWHGDNYRDAWGTQLKVQVLDLSKERGGLEIRRVGGGQSRLNLRLTDSLGREYVLRSVDKNVTGALPEFAHETWTQALAQDQVSGIHPFGAILVAPLAEAAGIYHTNPKMVFLPPQPGLEPNNDRFANRLYLFEEHPDDDRSDITNFGNSDKIINYTALIALMNEEQDHLVDQYWTLKSRIFDLLIHDWNRHDDQWRWAKFEYDSVNMYRPIPRDRDMAFYNLEGFLPWIASSFFLQKFQPMRETIKDVPGHAFNARHFDRFFINGLSKKYWIKAVEEIQTRMTNSAIDDAFEVWPAEFRVQHEPSLKEKLISRRDNLMEIALDLYDHLAREVVIYGTEETEYIYVDLVTEDSLTVQMFDKDHQLETYFREFLAEETTEIRIFGRGGADSIWLTGTPKNDITIRFIGGAGDDALVNECLREKVCIYDQPDNVYIEGTSKQYLTEDFNLNRYNRYWYRPNILSPQVDFGYNPDDRFYFGIGLLGKRFRYRSDPYHVKYEITGGYAPYSKAFRSSGYIHMPYLFRDLGGMRLATELAAPDVINYFGHGNETPEPNNEFKYHQVDISRFTSKVLYSFITSNEISLFEMGPYYLTSKISPEEDRIAVSEVDKGRFHYFGFFTGVNIDNSFGPVYPSEGLNFIASYSHLYNTEMGDRNSELIEDPYDGRFSILKAELRWYFNLGIHLETSMNLRVGTARMWGKAPFYLMPSLGGENTLRGYRSQRFIGDQTLFYSLEYRMDLFEWKNFIMPMNVGFNAAFDQGRVWLNRDSPGEYHNGYTFGLYFTPYDLNVINTYISHSKEDTYFNVRLGFYF